MGCSKFCSQALSYLIKRVARSCQKDFVLNKYLPEGNA
jgi:hypothetical protein